jgi:hypothetical protein
MFAARVVKKTRPIVIAAASIRCQGYIRSVELTFEITWRNFTSGYPVSKFIVKVSLQDKLLD